VVGDNGDVAQFDFIHGIFGSGQFELRISLSGKPCLNLPYSSMETFKYDANRGRWRNMLADSCCWLPQWWDRDLWESVASGMRLLACCKQDGHHGDLDRLIMTIGPVSGVTSTGGHNS